MLTSLTELVYLFIFVIFLILNKGYTMTTINTLEIHSDIQFQAKENATCADSSALLYPKLKMIQEHKTKLTQEFWHTVFESDHVPAQAAVFKNTLHVLTTNLRILTDAPLKEIRSLLDRQRIVVEIQADIKYYQNKAWQYLKGLEREDETFFCEILLSMLLKMHQFQSEITRLDYLELTYRNQHADHSDGLSQTIMSQCI